MSLTYQAGVYEAQLRNAEGKRHQRDYSFVLALICCMLALWVASVTFRPVAVDGAPANEVFFVGP